MIWTDDMCIQLKELWDTLKWSPRHIAVELGVSRNAIIGKVHRLGLQARRRARPPHLTSDPPFLTTPRFRKQPRQAPTPPDMPSIAPEMVSGGVSFMEASRFQCRAIVGRDDDFYGLVRFCGTPVVEGTSWCHYHAAIVFQPPRVR